MVPGIGLVLVPGLLIMSTLRKRLTPVRSFQAKAVWPCSPVQRQDAGGVSSHCVLPVTPRMAAWPREAERVSAARETRVREDMGSSCVLAGRAGREEWGVRSGEKGEEVDYDGRRRLMQAIPAKPSRAVAPGAGVCVMTRT